MVLAQICDLEAKSTISPGVLEVTRKDFLHAVASGRASVTLNKAHFVVRQVSFGPNHATEPLTQEPWPIHTSSPALTKAWHAGAPQRGL